MKNPLRFAPIRFRDSRRPCGAMLRAGCLVFFLSIYTAAPASAQIPPLPPGGITIDCGAGAEVGDESPAAADIVGDTAQGYWSGAIWHNADFVHFGLRINGDPTGTKGFRQQSWVALVNVPGANPFQYQYMISLNGNNVSGFSSDTVEIWRNDPNTAQNISFSPIFNDPAETNLTRIAYNDATLPNYPTAFCFGGNSLACSQTTTSMIGGDTDYLIFWAMPVSSLITAGAISQVSDLDDVLFFLSTSANPNNYNKDYLECPFVVSSELDIDKQVAPDALFQGGPTDLTYTIDVTNTASVQARGVVISDDETDGFDACLTFPANSVTIDCQGANGCSDPTLESDPPNLSVQVGALEVSGSVSITIAADAANCLIPGSSIINVASAFATTRWRPSGGFTGATSKP